MAVGGMQRSYDYTGGGPIYTDPDTGHLLMFYHAENKTDAGFWTTLGMARSTDGGDSWTDMGQIVTANLPFARDVGTDLGGGAYAVVNGYFYVYFRDFFPDGTQSFVSVARATYANVFSRPLLDGRGRRLDQILFKAIWGEPGLGGRPRPRPPPAPARPPACPPLVASPACPPFAARRPVFARLPARPPARPDEYGRESAACVMAVSRLEYLLE